MDNIEPSMDGYSIQSDQRKDIERRQDIEFEKQLRVFFKNMIERLNNQAADKIHRKSKAFCEQIDKIQNDYIQEKKEKKKKGEKDSKSDNNQGAELNDESHDREPGEDCDGDSSFQSILYGENSSLNPDNFIQEVLTALRSHTDLVKQFKRFIPEDDEDDIISLNEKYQ